MTRVLSLALLSFLAASSFAYAAPKASVQDELVQAQQDVISLQKQVIDFQAKSLKAYSANNICFPTQDGCIEIRDEFNLLSNGSVEVQPICEYAQNLDLNSDCRGKNAHWFLKTKVRILDQQQ